MSHGYDFGGLPSNLEREVEEFTQRQMELQHQQHQQHLQQLQQLQQLQMHQQHQQLLPPEETVDNGDHPNHHNDQDMAAATTTTNTTTTNTAAVKPRRRSAPKKSTNNNNNNANLTQEIQKLQKQLYETEKREEKLLMEARKSVAETEHLKTQLHATSKEVDQALQQLQDKTKESDELMGRLTKANENVMKRFHDKNKEVDLLMGRLAETNQKVSRMEERESTLHGSLRLAQDELAKLKNQQQLPQMPQRSPQGPGNPFPPGYGFPYNNHNHPMNPMNPMNMNHPAGGGPGPGMPPNNMPHQQQQQQGPPPPQRTSPQAGPGGAFPGSMMHPYNNMMYPGFGYPGFGPPGPFFPQGAQQQQQQQAAAAGGKATGSPGTQTAAADNKKGTGGSTKPTDSHAPHPAKKKSSSKPSMVAGLLLPSGMPIDVNAPRLTRGAMAAAPAARTRSHQTGTGGGGQASRGQPWKKAKKTPPPPVKQEPPTAVSKEKTSPKDKPQDHATTKRLAPKKQVNTQSSAHKKPRTSTGGATNGKPTHTANTGVHKTKKVEQPPKNAIEGGWPPGWRKEVDSYPSTNGDMRTIPHWFSPGNHKFRSMVQVRRFLQALVRCNGNEVHAMKLWKSERMSVTPTKAAKIKMEQTTPKTKGPEHGKPRVTTEKTGEKSSSRTVVAVAPPPPNNPTSIRERRRPLVQLSDRFEAICRMVTQREDVDPFLYPVSRREYPEYFQMVEHPIDMVAIQFKASSLQYHTAAAFLKDFELMMCNALEFNGEGHEIANEGVAIYTAVRDKLVEQDAEIHVLEESIKEMRLPAKSPTTTTTTAVAAVAETPQEGGGEDSTKEDATATAVEDVPGADADGAGKVEAMVTTAAVGEELQETKEGEVQETKEGETVTAMAVDEVNEEAGGGEQPMAETLAEAVEEQMAAEAGVSEVRDITGETGEEATGVVVVAEQDRETRETEEAAKEKDEVVVHETGVGEVSATTAVEEVKDKAGEEQVAEAAAESEVHETPPGESSETAAVAVVAEQDRESGGKEAAAKEDEEAGHGFFWSRRSDGNNDS